jgi:addiction module HigA family antidote
MCKQQLPPIYPGEILLEEFMEPLGLSANARAQRIGGTTSRVSEIANGQQCFAGTQ